MTALADDERGIHVMPIFLLPPSALAAIHHGLVVRITEHLDVAQAALECAQENLAEAHR